MLQGLTFMILVLARSPAKKTTYTLFSCWSVVEGSVTAPTAAVRRNMLPRVALNSSRSKEITWAGARRAVRGAA